MDKENITHLMNMDLLEVAKIYAREHRFDGTQIELYNECHNGKIKAFIAGANYIKTLYRI